MLLSLPTRKFFVLAALCLLPVLLFGEVKAFQIRDGNVLRIMQSGNPGTSDSYQINAKLRIEGNGIIVDNNLGALPDTAPPTDPEPPAATPPVNPGDGSGVPSRHVVLVCDLETNDFVNIFPTGNDGDYADYAACLVSSSGYICAEQWAFSKGYAPADACNDPSEPENESLLPSAPAVIDQVIEVVTPPVAAQPVEVIEPPVTTEAETTVVPLEVVERPETRRFDLMTGAENLTPREDWKLAAPENLNSEDVYFGREYLSCLRVPGFLVYNDWWKWLAYRLFFVLVMLVIIIFLLAFWVWLIYRRCTKDDEDENSQKKGMKKWFVLLLLLATAPLGGDVSAQVTTTPQILIYEGELLNDSAVPLSGNYTFRFSFWANADYEATDVVSGAINAAAVDFYSWQEVQTQVLNPGGRFSFQVGTVTPFIVGMFDQDDLYLQVEVKLSGTPDSDYEVIDVDATDILIDRKVIASVPYAFNANKLDYRELGYGPGDIPYIDPGTGQLPGSIIPGGGAGGGGVSGTDSNVFTIDQDGSSGAGDTLTLQFGDVIGETLLWNGVLDQFEFSNSLAVDGDLMVTGTINGVTIGPQNVAARLSPRYPNSIFEKDGSANSGSMYEEIDVLTGTLERHVIRWSTEQSSLQDYDILVRYALPHNFDSWLVPALELDYRTQSVLTDSHIDLTVQKEGDPTDQLGGVGLNLVDNAWASGTFNFTGGATWEPGDVVWIKMKMHSRASLDPRVGDIVLRYVVK